MYGVLYGVWCAVGPWFDKQLKDEKTEPDCEPKNDGDYDG
jgi:hypothetical protein